MYGDTHSRAKSFELVHRLANFASRHYRDMVDIYPNRAGLRRTRVYDNIVSLRNELQDLAEHVINTSLASVAYEEKEQAVLATIDALDHGICLKAIDVVMALHYDTDRIFPRPPRMFDFALAPKLKEDFKKLEVRVATQSLELQKVQVLGQRANFDSALKNLEQRQPVIDELVEICSEIRKVRTGIENQEHLHRFADKRFAWFLGIGSLTFLMAMIAAFAWPMLKATFKQIW